MKRIFFFASLAVVAIACNNNTNDSGSGSSADTSKAASSTTATTTPPKDPAVKKGLDLVASHACFGCHQVDKGIQGPAYSAVAARYPKNDAVIDSLSNKVMKGGSGNWGTIPMPPNPVTKEEAVTMVTYILSLKQ